MGFWDSSGISWTTCKQSAPRCRQIVTPTPHHSTFIGQMLFLTPNQQCQSTEGNFAVLLLLYIWITLVDFPVTVTPGNILRICPLVHVELTLMLCALNCCCSCGWYLLTALSRHYNAKMSFEHQLPTASQKLKVTDECILAAVVSLVTCTSKVSYPTAPSHSG